jgi:hypothetical protein
MVGGLCSGRSTVSTLIRLVAVIFSYLRGPPRHYAVEQGPLYYGQTESPLTYSRIYSTFSKPCISLSSRFQTPRISPTSGFFASIIRLMSQPGGYDHVAQRPTRNKASGSKALCRVSERGVGGFFFTWVCRRLAHVAV